MTGMKISPRYDGPPLISIDGAPDDQLAPVVRQRRRMEAMLAELSAEDWNAPSRCEGWTVQDVIAHIIGVNTFWEASVRAGLAGNPTRMLVGFDPAATPALMVGGMRSLTSKEVFDQFVSSNDGFLGAIADLDDRRMGDARRGASRPHSDPPHREPPRLWDTWRRSVNETRGGHRAPVPLGTTHPATGRVRRTEVMSSLRTSTRSSSTPPVAVEGASC